MIPSPQPTICLPPFPLPGKRGEPDNQQTLAERIANLVHDAKAQELATAYGGMRIMSVTWEDCGRWDSSCYGPCISDLTLQCAGEGPLMPVVRKPNYTDITCDVKIDNFVLTVGNENGQPLTKVPLRDFLKDISRYVKNPNVAPMYLERDEQILTSTQACILPLRDGKVEFNVKLFNYQYDEEDPAVLVIVASKNGTSVQPIVEYNQSLFFNDKGMAANFVAQRLSEHRKETGSTATGAMTQEEKESNVLFIFQVPLKQTKPKRVPKMYSMYGGGDILECAPMMPMMACMDMGYEPKCLGLEDAIISTGEAHSVFKGTGDLKLVRDERFPVRAVIQYYSVCDTADIPAEVFKSFAEKLERPYKHAVATGSLVVEKDTGRVTSHEVKKPEPYVSPVPGPWIW
jgi:hypothetical protein